MESLRHLCKKRDEFGLTTDDDLKSCITGMYHYHTSSSLGTCSGSCLVIRSRILFSATWGGEGGGLLPAARLLCRAPSAESYSQPKTAGMAYRHISECVAYIYIYTYLHGISIFYMYVQYVYIYKMYIYIYLYMYIHMIERLLGSI